MKSFQSLVPVFGLVAAAQAWGSGWNDTTVWTTEVVTELTTFCPESTTLTYGTKTYTATESETLTITDCPCTISKPVTKPTPTPSYTYVPPVNSTWTPIWITTTETVSEYTTYCPAPTTVVEGNKTYTVSSATTLTVSECPCTRTSTLPGTTSVVTVGSTTTYCPSSTVITTGGSTVTTSGSVTLPICSTTTYAITTPVSTYPASSLTTVVPPASTYPGSVGTTSVKTGPSPTTSGPVQISANAAAIQHMGYGAIVAGLAAMIL
ncbi:hypothetical protein BDZ45DRAFT_672678 [Acephala macrosclerotiorum]|nr:hypothetical protein BDZ45DRAFT_672678 [Acephala macrosclerotiorum]